MINLNTVDIDTKKISHLFPDLTCVDFGMLVLIQMSYSGLQDIVFEFVTENMDCIQMPSRWRGEDYKGLYIKFGASFFEIDMNLSIVKTDSADSEKQHLYDLRLAENRFSIKNAFGQVKGEFLKHSAELSIYPLTTEQLANCYKSETITLPYRW